MLNSHPPALDVAVLQFAANLEFLEDVFYQQGLAIFNDTNFTDAGFAPGVRGRFLQIAGHEATHVQLINSVLGSDAPQACNYTLCVLSTFVDVVILLTLRFYQPLHGCAVVCGAFGGVRAGWSFRVPRSDCVGYESDHLDYGRGTYIH